MHKFIRAALFMLLATNAYAQQIIAKGSWSEVAPSAEGPITLGVAKTAAECVAAIQGGLAAANAKEAALQNSVNADESTVNDDQNAEAAGTESASSDKNLDDMRQMNGDVQSLQAEALQVQLYSSANCVQN